MKNRFVFRRLALAAGLVAVAVPNVPAQAARSVCDGRGGVRAATVRLVRDEFRVRVTCEDGTNYRARFPVGGPYPCASNGGAHSAKVRPGAGVIEITVYCNDGTSETFAYQFAPR